MSEGEGGGAKFLELSGWAWGDMQAQMQRETEAEQATGRAKRGVRRGAGAGQVAAGFEYLSGSAMCLPVSPIGANGRRTLIDLQRFRNNYALMPLRRQMSHCRLMAGLNWFLRGVLPVRHAATVDGCVVRGEDGSEPEYDFAGVISDAMWEELTSSNVVGLWRKGVEFPQISVPDAERIDYEQVGGVEVIRLNCGGGMRRIQDMRSDTARKIREKLVDNLGERMANAYIRGGEVEIVKGMDEDWDFEVMHPPGKRDGNFVRPEIVPILDSLDFLELMGVGDWNLAWARKDVIRTIHKGYVPTGTLAEMGPVNISKPQIQQLGEGFGKVSGNANMPLNHDVKLGYLGVEPDAIKPEQVASHIDRIMVFGGMEAVILLGGFSQQNGASPSLMRNMRMRVLERRVRMERWLRAIGAADEFAGLGKLSVEWSLRGLHSVEELMALVRGTADGTASPQTRRRWLDLDDAEEVANMEAAHENREGYVPPYEHGQGLLPSMFPLEFPGAQGVGGDGPPGEPGRPRGVEGD